MKCNRKRPIERPKCRTEGRGGRDATIKYNIFVTSSQTLAKARRREIVQSKGVLCPLSAAIARL